MISQELDVCKGSLKSVFFLNIKHVIKDHQTLKYLGDPCRRVSFIAGPGIEYIFLDRSNLCISHFENFCFFTNSAADLPAMLP